jgi:hypothetical protein
MHEGSLEVFSAQDTTLTLRGDLMSSRVPNVVQILVNNRKHAEWPAAPRIDITLQLRKGENIVTLVSSEPGLRPPPDDRLLAIGLRNVEFTALDGEPRNCEIQF